MSANIPPPPAREPFLVSNYTAPAWVIWFNQMRNAMTPNYASLVDAANDAAAASAGVAIGSLYRTGNTIKVRLA